MLRIGEGVDEKNDDGYIDDHEEMRRRMTTKIRRIMRIERRERQRQGACEFIGLFFLLVLLFKQKI